MMGEGIYCPIIYVCDCGRRIASKFWIHFWRKRWSCSPFAMFDVSHSGLCHDAEFFGKTSIFFQRNFSTFFSSSLIRAEQTLSSYPYWKTYPKFWPGSNNHRTDSYISGQVNQCWSVDRRDPRIRTLRTRVNNQWSENWYLPILVIRAKLAVLMCAWRYWISDLPARAQHDRTIHIGLGT